MNIDFFNFLKNECGIDFNQKQKSAIIHKKGPVLVLASPGSGKTTVLNAHIAYLILKAGINPKNVLALTFSKAATRDMDDRFYNTYGKLIPDGVKFSTIHSFAYKMIRRYYYKNNIDYDLIEGKKVHYNKQFILKKLNRNINGSNINDDKLEELSNAIGFVKNLMIEPEEFKHYNFKVKNFRKIYDAYENYKRNNEFGKRLLDFDDMLLEANNILENNKDILKKYQKQYEYVLMDEGQDTSLIQNKIIEKIALPQNNLFIVCDDDQSIFGFRGANPRYFLDFQNRYPRAKVIFMEQNYRSAKNIVEVSNKLIKNNNIRYPKNMFTENPTKTPIKIVKLSSEKEQVEYVVNSITREKDLGEIAILYRNNISSVSITQKLYENQIPIYMKDYYRNFFTHWVLNDILNFVRFSYDDTNIHLLQSIYTKFNSYISKKELENLKHQDDSKSVFDNLIDQPHMKEFKKRSLKSFKKDFRHLKTLRPQQAIKFIRKDLKYEEKLEGYCEITGYSFDNIKEILEILEELSKDTFTMQEFVDKLNNLKKVMFESRYNRNENAVTLSTLHSAKGLEFRKVFMIDLIDGQIPTSESIKLSSLGDTDAIEEERRLWYVGMTRAKEELELITMEYKNNVAVEPSRFIKEVNEIIGRTENDRENIHFKTDSIVRHKKFGLGIVKDIAASMVTIDFDEKGEKQLSLDMCIKKNLLKVINY